MAGLDVGWGQQVDLQLDPATQRFVVQRELPPGTYQFKFIMVSAVHHGDESSFEWDELSVHEWEWSTLPPSTYQCKFAMASVVLCYF